MSLRYPAGIIKPGNNGLLAPNPPTIGTASIAGETSLAVTFTAPSGTVTGYMATAKKTSDSTTTSTSGSSSPITVTGLTTGAPYTVCVAALNTYGNSLMSAASNSATPNGFQLWSWGRNDNAQLGLGNVTFYSSPKQVGALTNWLNIACGYSFIVSTKTDGTLWSWGSGTNGKLGLGNTTNYSSPKQVGALTTWLNVACGYQHTLATKTDGTLWSWGRGSFGSLGLGNTTNYSSPKQVGALTTWLKVSCPISSSASFAIKTDGTLWSWGSGGTGQLGLGNTTNYSSPKQVGALTTWSTISCSSATFSFATKTDGTLWSWGGNAYGQLGLGNTTSYSSPKQVGALTTWAKSSCGTEHTTAIRTDGALYSWGRNQYGQLGLVNTTYYSSPKQVGALTTWASIACGDNHTLATKTDGTLWSWGRNDDGQLGQNTLIIFNVSSPVQVGALTTWSTISAGSAFSTARKTP